MYYLDAEIREHVVPRAEFCYREKGKLALAQTSSFHVWQRCRVRYFFFISDGSVPRAGYDHHSRLGVSKPK